MTHGTSFGGARNAALQLHFAQIAFGVQSALIRGIYSLIAIALFGGAILIHYFLYQTFG